RVEIVSNSVLATELGMLWHVGMTNAFNLLDNMDGLAATLAGIAFTFFAIDAVTIHPSHTILALSLAGALSCAGFLPFNLRPHGKALIFMGDSGSQVLGFTLAALGLSASWKVAGTTVATLLLPVLVLAVPILDTSLVTIARLLEGRPISQGGRDHSSHRLVRFGLSEKHAVLLLAVIASALGATSLAYNVLDDQRLALVGVLVTFVLLVQFASFLADVEKRAPGLETPGLMQTFAVHWRRLVEVVVDFGLITGAFAAAFLLQFGWPGSPSQRHIALVTLPIVIAARYLAFIPFGLYRSIWRYAGARDVVAIASAVAVSEVVALAYIVLTQDTADFTRSFFIVDGLLCVVTIGGSRLVERALVTGLRTYHARTGRKTLIVGAGRTGRSLMRELRETAGERVVGFVDDNPRLRRRRVHGVPVVGAAHELPRLLQRLEPDIVLITIPDAPREHLDAVVDACSEAGVTCRVVRREIDLDPRVFLGTVTGE
ncbi:MAG: UDP-GlcNAc:undecaprenyl-phosphate/decaprenyl-phosphate GlcNAc-phosphate transferase, partial [Gaiellaceae bacterium]|nr:UDP-GlcNAc:undecaprenyl-phosphate/decaprenyl-phosphate GlcNAc-phosphate transferase [Gaiellaceae bacterium]